MFQFPDWPNLLLFVLWSVVSALCLRGAWKSRDMLSMNDYGSGFAGFVWFGWCLFAFGPPIIAIWTLFGEEKAVNGNLFTLGMVSLCALVLLLGALCRSAWNAIFTCKAKSLEDFIALVKKAGGEITIQPCRDARGVSDPRGSGETLGTFLYGLRFLSRTPRGRELVYEEYLFDRYGSSQSIVDAAERSKSTMKLLLIGEQKVAELRARIPGISRGF